MIITIISSLSLVVADMEILTRIAPPICLLGKKMGNCCCITPETHNDGESITEPLLLKGTYKGTPDKKWYHGKISHDEAEARLREGAGGNDGSYLVYDNPNKLEFILLVYYKGNLLRWKIWNRQVNETGISMQDDFILGEDGGPGVTGYKTVRELIKAHRGVSGKPIKLENGETVTLSKSYVFVVD